MYDDDYHYDEAEDYWYEEEMRWKHEHPIQAWFKDFMWWVKWRVNNLPRYTKNFFKTGKFEDELPF